jgi:carbonic anhydrase
MGAIDEVLSNVSEGGSGLPASPARGLAVLTCMDARIDVHRLLGLEPGDAHVVRNAGGLVTEDALRSLLLSQRVLGTREIMVIQHTGCGMIDLPEGEIKARIRDETGVEPPFELGAFSDLEESVARAVAALRESVLLAHRDEVRGFIFDVSSGLLTEVD